MKISSSAALSDSESDSSDNDGQDDFGDLLPRMRSHIHNGIRMVARAGEVDYMAGGYKDAVTLVKCSSMTRLSSALSPRRRSFARKRFHDERMGWNKEGGFSDFRMVRFSGQHDSAFDGAYAGELTDILRGVLSNIA